MVKKVNMFKKKCSVCIFLIYNGSKPKHFLFDIYSTTVELMAINGCIAISRFVPFFVRVLLLTLLRSELIISILCDVAYPWESLVSTLFNDLQISHLKKNHLTFSDWNLTDHCGEISCFIIMPKTSFWYKHSK